MKRTHQPFELERPVQVYDMAMRRALLDQATGNFNRVLTINGRLIKLALL